MDRSNQRVRLTKFVRLTAACICVRRKQSGATQPSYRVLQPCKQQQGAAELVLCVRGVAVGYDHRSCCILAPGRSFTLWCDQDTSSLHFMVCKWLVLMYAVGCTSCCLAAAPKHNILLEDIAQDQRLNLRFEKICAYVSTEYEQPSVVDRLRRAVSKDARDAAAEAKKKQVCAEMCNLLVFLCIQCVLWCACCHIWCSQ